MGVDDARLRSLIERGLNEMEGENEAGVNERGGGIHSGREGVICAHMYFQSSRELVTYTK